MRLALLLTLFASLGFATTITYTISDVFPANTATSSLSAPNVPFTLTFSLPDQPVPSSTFTHFFTVQPGGTLSFGSTTASFVSNPSNTQPMLSITFYDSSLGGGLSVIMTGAPPQNIFDPYTLVILGFSANQLFSGPTSAPTLLPGQYPVNNELHFSFASATGGGLDFFSDPGNISAVSDASDLAVPEPTSFALLGLALPALWIFRRRRSRSAQRV